MLKGHIGQRTLGRSLNFQPALWELQQSHKAFTLTPAHSTSTSLYSTWILSVFF